MFAVVLSTRKHIRRQLISEGGKVFSNLIAEVAKTRKAFKVKNKYVSLHG